MFKKYFVETKRYFKVRKKEHISDTTHKRTDRSHVAEHAVRCGHVIDWNNAKIIRPVSDDFNRKMFETIAIRTSDENLLINKNFGEYLPKQWFRFLKPLK